MGNIIGRLFHFEGTYFTATREEKPPLKSATLENAGQAGQALRGIKEKDLNTTDTKDT